MKLDEIVKEYRMRTDKDDEASIMKDRMMKFGKRDEESQKHHEA